ncbi:MAG TPA: LppX_LprAFG lipoprotein [Pseudonocardiaceae bacterium]|jgi:lipoprotein LprG
MRRRLLVVLGLFAVLLAGCSSGGTANLPAASTLLSSSGAAMRAVTSVHFSITVNGTLAGVPIQNADGDLNAQGQAKGNAKISELGQTLQVDFVLVNKTFYLKGATGGYQKIPAALAGNLFDPTAILDPNRGVAKVLTSVQGASTQGQESVNGTDCYRITGKVAKGVVAALVPGINSDVTATLWVATAGKHLPVKAEFAVPGNGGSQGARVDVVISNVNEPVSVTAPA